jgi:hypothetical protein
VGDGVSGVDDGAAGERGASIRRLDAAVGCARVR